MDIDALKENRLYPIIFMIIITIIFVGILAALYHSTKARVTQYQELELKTSILSVFDLSSDQIEEDYSRYITEKKENDILYYIAQKDQEVLGYAFMINGKGLWGSIQAIVSYTPDFSQIIGFRILNQSETPGLGARITEAWFMDQFKKRPLIKDHQINIFSLISENDAVKNDQEIKQITGATLSSKSIVNMINDESQRIIKALKVKYE